MGFKQIAKVQANHLATSPKKVGNKVQLNIRAMKKKALPFKTPKFKGGKKDLDIATFDTSSTASGGTDGSDVTTPGPIIWYWLTGQCWGSGYCMDAERTADLSFESSCDDYEEETCESTQPSCSMENRFIYTNVMDDISDVTSKASIHSADASEGS